MYVFWVYTKQKPSEISLGCSYTVADLRGTANLRQRPEWSPASWYWIQLWAEFPCYCEGQALLAPQRGLIPWGCQRGFRDHFWIWQTFQESSRCCLGCCFHKNVQTVLQVVGYTILGKEEMLHRMWMWHMDSQLREKKSYFPVYISSVCVCCLIHMPDVYNCSLPSPWGWDLDSSGLIIHGWKAPALFYVCVCM